MNNVIGTFFFGKGIGNGYLSRPAVVDLYGTAVVKGKHECMILVIDGSYFVAALWKPEFLTGTGFQRYGFVFSFLITIVDRVNPEIIVTSAVSGVIGSSRFADSKVTITQDDDIEFSACTGSVLSIFYDSHVESFGFVLLDGFHNIIISGSQSLQSDRLTGFEH